MYPRGSMEIFGHDTSFNLKTKDSPRRKLLLRSLKTFVPGNKNKDTRKVSSDIINQTVSLWFQL